MLDGGHVPVLERCFGAALNPGQIGLILAPAGLGKSNLVAQFGLAAMLAGSPVLHVAQGEPIRAVRSRYQELLADYLRLGQLADPVGARAAVERNHLVQSYAKGSCSTARLNATLSVLAEHAQFVPKLILVDGIDWRSAGSAHFASWRRLAWSHDAAMWLTALSPSGVTQLGPDQLPGMLSEMTTLVDRALQVVPAEGGVAVRLLGGDDDSPQEVLLDPTWMRPLAAREQSAGPDPAQPERYTLYSGAAAGSEACFGAMAERFGVAEVNFSYPSHRPARARGLVVLSERELRKGDVSLAYANQRLARSLDLSHGSRRILQTLWHQVQNADQVLVVGELREDGTLRGGTGWAGELARIWGKLLWVFDQPREQWFRWDITDSTWRESIPPRLQRARFCGTGTRKLNEVGRRAIEAVFEDSFGASASASSKLQ